MALIAGRAPEPVCVFLLLSVHIILGDDAFSRSISFTAGRSAYRNR